MATRVDRILGAALAGEPHVSISVKLSELIADAEAVSDTVNATMERPGLGILGRLRVLQALARNGLNADLLNSLVDPNPDVRIAAARLCGAFRIGDAVPWLADMMSDSKPAVREAAVRALGQLGGSASVDALMSAVDRLPRFQLAIALAHAASDMDIEALIREPESVEAAVITVLACGLRHDRLRVDPLTGIAHDRRWPSRVRAAACRALAMIGEPASAEWLRRLTGDPDATVRLAAAKGLKRFQAAAGDQA